MLSGPLVKRRGKETPQRPSLNLTSTGFGTVHLQQRGTAERQGIQSITGCNMMSDAGFGTDGIYANGPTFPRGG